jgi:hypothetical protein
LWPSPHRLESLAYAALRANRLEDAERAYREYVAQPLLGDEEQASWIRSLHRLGYVLELRGDTAGAISFYRRFLDLWGGGDDGLPDVAEVRTRLSGLGRTTDPG